LAIVNPTSPQDPQSETVGERQGFCTARSSSKVARRKLHPAEVLGAENPDVTAKRRGGAAAP